MRRRPWASKDDVGMSGRCLGLLGLSLCLSGSLGFSSGCDGGIKQGGPAGSGPAGQSGQMGQTGTGGQGQAGAATAGQGAGTAGSTGGSAGAGGATGTAGSIGPAGSAGAMGVAGVAGTAGAGGAPTAGSTGVAGATVLTDPGKDGDGDFTVPSGFKPDPANNATGAPQGKIITFVMSSADSKIYPGRKGAYMRNVWAYVPAQYVAGTPAPVIVVQDGGWAVWFGTNGTHTPSSGAAALLPGT